jgi:predicted secreted acid phosphatase
MEGTTGTRLPALNISMWLGDNITDFPELDQHALRAVPDTAFAKFGTTYFVFPNPVYGSWASPP